MNAKTARRQKSLALIRAREVATNLSLPMVVLDAEGTIVFYNAAAEAVGGAKFADTGEVSGEDWANTYRPEHLDGTLATLDSLPAGVALRERRPDHQRIRFRSLDGQLHEVSITAFPLVGREEELYGAVTVFWLGR
jgi:PAS domain-containing protein